LLVLSAAFSAAGPILLPDSLARGIATVLLAVGAPLALLVGVVWASEVVDNAPIGLEKVTGTWFLPPVIAVLVPLAAAPLIASWPAPVFWLWMSYAFAGAGLLLFFLVAVLVIARLALKGPPPPPLAPAVWIALGPPGAGGVVLVRLSQTAEATGIAASDALRVTSVVLATAMLGFAFWWLAFASMVLRRQLKRGPVPYSPAWWAWTFPLGAMTALTLLLGSQWGSTAVEALGVVLLFSTLAVWGVVAGRTVAALRSGDAWVRHG
jgi:tellurite resistance protein TehA-like permease